MSTPVAVATSSELAALAGARVAREGGNAVDAAVAALLVQLASEPGVVSPSASAFVHVWAPGERPVVVDGGAEMPGRGADAARRGRNAPEVHLTYGGGMQTRIGPGSVAAVGGVLALGRAAERWGRRPWESLVAPAIDVARDGFPMPPASHRYLEHTQAVLYASDEARTVLLGADGRVRPPGSPVRIPGLAATFRALAEEGPACFTTGSIGRRVAEAVWAGGGLLGPEDQEAYAVREGPAIAVELDGWDVATCPAPSVGGAIVAAVLLGMRDLPADAEEPALVDRLVRVTDAVLRFRDGPIRAARDLPPALEELLMRAADDTLVLPREAPSTVHTSAVDADGLACAITASAGYGSGVSPKGTGLWLNNALGELELNPEGLHAGAPGTRLRSNMAPTVARRGDGAVVAIGSPGADRITSAIAQTLVQLLRRERPLAEAVAHPRLHVEPAPDGGRRVAHEPGLPVEGLGLQTRAFDEPHMFFGGVAAARRTPGGALEAAADPRRTGGTAITG